MQFLWRIVEELVGKGLDNIVLFELFIYATISLIPMALPLSLLLASLMTFGNLGERLELLAIKASGVSLLRLMRPLIILVICIAIGAFFFQNEAMPRTQVKLKSLLISIKQKSPELEIPEGSFYNGINNYSIYVKKKNPETKMLKEVMIYDMSKGFDNMAVIVCDSALLRVSEDKKYLLLNLYHGQQFSNVSQSDINMNQPRNGEFPPYLRENFVAKEVVIPFDSGFDRVDESNLDGTQISKNIVQLSNSIDSLSKRLDSINIADRKLIGQNTFLTYRNREVYKNKKEESKNTATTQNQTTSINFDSVMTSFTLDEASRYLNIASSESDNANFFMMDAIPKVNLQRNIRVHQIEWQRKFVLSFACLIFFFIGAPLGAIIRKGGLGMPVVVSVILFIIYYIIDNIGYKLARDGVWIVWQGMWLSSFVLFPLGVFLTYKAMNDSALFNSEAYGNFFRKILGLNKKPIFDNYKNVDESTIPDWETLDVDPEIISSFGSMNIDTLKDIMRNHQQYGYSADTLTAVLSILKSKGASFFDIKIRKIDVNEAEQYSKLFIKNLKFAIIAYIPVISFTVLYLISGISTFGYILTLSLLAYTACFLKSFISYFDFCRCIDKTINIRLRIITILSFLCIIGLQKKLKIQVKEDLNNLK